MSLPATRSFITKLLDSLPSVASNAGENVNPLSGVPESAKNQLLSLQVLFPNEFLPALDLLDRGLVTRLSVGDGEEEGGLDTEGGGLNQRSDVDAEGPHDVNMEDPMDSSMVQNPTVTMQDTEGRTSTTEAPPHYAATRRPPPKDAIYYVRSAQQRSSRYSTSYDTTTSYEVRLRAWNCSCPAFAFAAFPAVHPEPAIPTYDAQEDAAEEASGKAADMTWVFGGVSLGDEMPPVCKHLLACVLVEKCAGLFGGYVEDTIVSVEEAAGWAAGWGD